MAQLTSKRMEELIAKDRELAKIVAILALLAGIHTVAAQSITDRSSRCIIPPEHRVPIKEVFDLLNLEDGLESIASLEEPREHRELLKELRYDIELLGGVKTACGRTLLAATERLRALISDIAEARREEIRVHIEQELQTRLARGLNIDAVMGELRQQFVQEAQLGCA